VRASSSGERTNSGPTSAQQPPPGAPDAYEPDDSPAEAKPLLLVGVPQRRSFHTGEDNDWASFWLDAGERVQVYTSGPCDTYLYLYAPDGTSILAQDDDSAGGSNAAVRYFAAASGEYHVRARLYSASAGPCASYELIGQVVPLPEPDAYEPDDTPAQAKPFPPDGTFQRRTIHQSADEDWVSLSLERNSSVGLATSGPCDTYMELYAPNGRTILAEDDDSGRFGNAAIFYTALETGTYYARVRLFDQVSGVCDGYELGGILVPSSPADRFEPDDSYAQARPLPLDATPQQRSFHIPRDEDWVRFPLAANERAFLFTEGTCDTYLSLYGPDGRTLLAEDDDSGGGTNAAVLYKAVQAGSHYLRVRLFGDPTRTCPSYTLTGVLVPAGGPTPTPSKTVTPPPGGTPSPTATPPRR
jgi:hypothetical protein